MTFNIDDFKANWQDLSRVYNFYILIDNPAGGDTGTTRYLVQSSSMPPTTIDPIEVNWQGMVFPLGSTQTFSDWTVTFRLDSSSQLRKDFMNWQKMVHDPVTNVHGSPNDYMQDQEIQNLDPQGSIIEKLKLINAWPTTVGELTLDYGSKEVHTFDVTFRYLYHMSI